MEGAAIGVLGDELDKTDTDIPVMLIAFKVNAQTPLAFTKEEFVEGLSQEGVQDLQSLRKKTTEWRAQLQTTQFFRDFYRFCFDWTRPSSNQRTLGYEAAVDLWNLLMKDRWPLLSAWTEYIKNTYKKGISKDVWLQFLDFTALKHDMSDYDPAGAWPVLFDEFVEHYKKTTAATSEQ
jgi:hypothetical protein